MYVALISIAKRFWPDLESRSYERQLTGAGDVVIALAMTPLAVIGLIWLVLSSDLTSISQNISAYLLFGLLQLVFSRVKYFFIITIRADRYASAEGSLASMVQWTSIFLLGPTAIWLTLLGVCARFIIEMRRAGSIGARWNQYRSFIMELTAGTIAYLGAFYLYDYMGGQVPIAGLSLETISIAFTALVANMALVLLIWSGYIAFAIWVQPQVVPNTSIRPIINFFMRAFGLTILANPFAILVAGLYVQNGLLISLFLLFGLLFVAVLARQLSWAGESSRQQSLQLQQLEQLGRDIINAPLDGSSLPSLLEKHVPAMFPSGRVLVWLSPDQILHKHPQEWIVDVEPIWTWVRRQPEAQAFVSQKILPWRIENEIHDPVVAAPILDVENSQPIGCVYIELRSLAQPWDRKALTSLFPGVHSLTDHIASVVFQSAIYDDTLDYQATLQELEFAGRIQASFLPNEMPSLDGWELAVTLLPARETSGDFFDFIQLSDNKIGIIIADVADKGVGAALYMALSRTLIRTYALEYDVQPDIVFFSANERILQDARANLFVTAFYGILDVESGTFNYSNAGHNPPFLFSYKDGGTINALMATGMPLGIDEDASWTQASVHIEAGDSLILYTDGIPDAQDPQGNFFKEKQLIEISQQALGSGAQGVQSAILNAVQDFVSGAAQFDDITLLVLQRDPNLENEAGPEQLDEALETLPVARE